MATQSSSAPPAPTDNKPQNPASEVVQTTLEDQKNMAEATQVNSSPSVFVNSEPMREDQVQNAVKFLSHPKVRGSPVVYRRSFLERKGLTKEEIDEAFRRVPVSKLSFFGHISLSLSLSLSPPPPFLPLFCVIQPRPFQMCNQLVQIKVISICVKLGCSNCGSTPRPSHQSCYTCFAMLITEGQMKSSSNIQPQDPSRSLQPAVVAPPGAISKVGTLSRFHWSHALLAVGLLAVSGAGTAVLFKVFMKSMFCFCWCNTIIPRLKSWIRKVAMEEDEDPVEKQNSKPSVAEEAAAAAKAAAAAAADVARASHEMLVSKTEEKRCFKELMDLLDVQVREMKSMSHTIQKLEGQSNTPGRISLVEQEDHKVSVTSSRVSIINA
ncbi:unnamed protein product [Ilex paraguariensis]|uniref:Peroxisomal membrane protein PEX14 n=1 Tax=Ilex paraguariensis TaxID=185542 RepID=A0ABC8R0W9_9AQUA